MAVTDPEAERRRMASTYAAMADEELSRLAAEEDALSDAAREVLRQELARRGLRVPPHEPPAPEPTPRNEYLPVTIHRFRDLPEAWVVKGGLDSAGIECFLLDENMIRLDWLYSNLLGGIRLQVGQADAEAALGILDAPIPEHFEVEGVGDFRQPRCPKCQSLDISMEGLDKSLSYATLFINLPIPFYRISAKCHACGCRWQDSEWNDF